MRAPLVTGPSSILLAGLALSSLGLFSRAQDPTGTQGGGQSNASRSIPVVPPAYGTADSNGTMIAVTGVDVTGGSLLYLIDTASRHLSVYQATGGTASTMS